MDLKATIENMKKGDEERKKHLPKVEGAELKTFYDDKKSPFNIYKKCDRKTASPLIIYVHGGAWIYGDIHLEDEYCEYLASKGFDVISLSYPLLFSSYGVNLKVMIQSLHSTFDYIFKNQKKYKVDFSKVMFVGDSAGAHLVSLLYATLSLGKYQKLFNVSSKFSYKDVVQIVLNHPVINPLNFIDDPQQEVIKNYFLNAMFNGENDTFKEACNALNFLKTMQNPHIIIVSSAGDSLNKFSLGIVEKCKEYNLDYEYIYVNNKELGHIFNLAYYHLDESKKVNDYILKKYQSIII